MIGYLCTMRISMNHLSLIDKQQHHNHHMSTISSFSKHRKEELRYIAKQRLMFCFSLLYHSLEIERREKIYHVIHKNK